MSAGNTTGCVQGTANSGRIKALEDKADRNDLEHSNFVEAIREIRDHLLGRPSWPIAFLLMALSSICCTFIAQSVLSMLKP